MLPRSREVAMERRRDSARIAELNDQMRHDGPESTASRKWMLTSGVRALGDAAVADAIAHVRTFDAFGRDNDPYGERDFGAFSLLGDRLFWKIDYYNRTLDGGSPDPADPNVTCRVLTIMLTMEY